MKFVWCKNLKCRRLQPEKLWAYKQTAKWTKKCIGLVSDEDTHLGICLWGCTRTKLQLEVQMNRLSVSLRTALIPICFYRSLPWTQRWCQNSPQKMRKSITGNACLSNTRRGKLKSLTTSLNIATTWAFLQLCSLPSHKSHGESAVYVLTSNLDFF